VTTYVPFQPSALQNFQFAATFDGSDYSITITWNYWGQRFYANCATTQGALVYSLPLIASPDDFDININASYFTTSTFVYRGSSGNFEISP
jgi:hypothetical protein